MEKIMENEMEHRENMSYGLKVPTSWLPLNFRVPILKEGESSHGSVRLPS